jgi:hypothetical protein
MARKESGFSWTHKTLQERFLRVFNSVYSINDDELDDISARV